MPYGFKKKPIFSASLVALLFFVAFALSVAGSIDFFHREGGSAVISWSSPAGAGVSVPACASAGIPPVVTTCNRSIAEATISWTDPNSHGEGVNVDVCEGSWCSLIVYTPAGMFNGAGWDAFTLPAAGSVTLTPLKNNTTYLYAIRSVTETGVVTVAAAYPTFTTPNCAGGGGSAPVAEAGISLDGVSFGTSVSVLRGIGVQMWFSADKDVTGDGLSSRDPDGWTDSTDGVSNGGKCEWNIDLRRPGFFVQRTVSDPASPAGCNQGPFAKTFNDAPGTYLYEILRITDAAALESNISTVFVTVTSPISVSLIANPPIINPGGTSLLTWDTEGFGPGDCSIDQGIGAVSSDGTKLVSPAVTTTYTLLCSDGTNSGSTRATVYVSTLPIIKEIPPR